MLCGGGPRLYGERSTGNVVLVRYCGSWMSPEDPADKPWYPRHGQLSGRPVNGFRAQEAGVGAVGPLGVLGGWGSWLCCIAVTWASDSK